MRFEKSEIYDGVTLRRSDRMRTDCDSIVMACLFSLVRGMIRHDRTNGSVKSSSQSTEPRRDAQNAVQYRSTSRISFSHIRSHERTNYWHSIALLESRVKSVGCTRARGLTRHVRAANLLCVTRYRNRRSFVSDSRSLAVLRDAAVVGINFRLHLRRNLGFTFRRSRFHIIFFLIFILEINRFTCKYIYFFLRRNC